MTVRDEDAAPVWAGPPTWKWGPTWRGGRRSWFGPEHLVVVRGRGKDVDVPGPCRGS